MLILFAEVGALLGVAVLAVSIRAGVIAPLSAPPARPLASPPPDAAVECPLHASPPACDACMHAHCQRECQSCAASPDCLDLFLCATDCTDPSCESECGARFPQGKQLLQLFVGQTGCLAIFCRDACRGPAPVHD